MTIPVLGGGALIGIGLSMFLTWWLGNLDVVAIGLLFVICLGIGTLFVSAAKALARWIAK